MKILPGKNASEFQPNMFWYSLIKACVIWFCALVMLGCFAILGIMCILLAGILKDFYIHFNLGIPIAALLGMLLGYGAGIDEKKK